MFSKKKYWFLLTALAIFAGVAACKKPNKTPDTNPNQEEVNPDPTPNPDPVDPKAPVIKLWADAKMETELPLRNDLPYVWGIDTKVTVFIEIADGARLLMANLDVEVGGNPTRNLEITEKFVTKAGGYAATFSIGEMALGIPAMRTAKITITAKDPSDRVTTASFNYMPKDRAIVTFTDKICGTPLANNAFTGASKTDMFALNIQVVEGLAIKTLNITYDDDIHITDNDGDMSQDEIASFQTSSEGVVSKEYSARSIVAAAGMDAEEKKFSFAGKHVPGSDATAIIKVILVDEMGSQTTEQLLFYSTDMNYGDAPEIRILDANGKNIFYHSGGLLALGSKEDPFKLNVRLAPDAKLKSVKVKYYEGSGDGGFYHSDEKELSASELANYKMVDDAMEREYTILRLKDVSGLITSGTYTFTYEGVHDIYNEKDVTGIFTFTVTDDQGKTTEKKIDYIKAPMVVFRGETAVFSNTRISSIPSSGEIFTLRVYTADGADLKEGTAYYKSTRPGSSYTTTGTIKVGTSLKKGNDGFYTCDYTILAEEMGRVKTDQTPGELTIKVKDAKGNTGSATLQIK